MEITHTPTLRYRVLATDWEAEMFIECWTENLDSANAVAAALTTWGKEVTVQVDKVVKE